MTNSIAKILVYGATGDQARPVARQLLEAGHQVRVLTRQPAKADELKALGAETVVGDLTDPKSLRRASEGVDGVFLLVPFTDPQAQYGFNAIDAAKAAGVKLVVWNSTGTILPVRTSNPGLDVRLDLLEYLRASGLRHIVLQPTAYMENFLGPWTAPEIAAKDTFAYPISSEARVQFISHEDVAAFAVAAFQRPRAADAVYQLAGPERLGGEDVAERLTRTLGRTITFRSMPPAEFGAVLDGVFGPGAGDDATAFYEASLNDPSLISTDFDIAPVLDALPIELTPLETWARGYADVLTRQAGVAS